MTYPSLLPLPPNHFPHYSLHFLLLCHHLLTVHNVHLLLNHHHHYLQPENVTSYSYRPVYLYLACTRHCRKHTNKQAVLAVDDRHVAFCEYNGSVARIICVAVATLANEKLLERASYNDLLLCRSQLRIKRVIDNDLIDV